jgi:hypothetical protein
MRVCCLATAFCFSFILSLLVQMHCENVQTVEDTPMGNSEKKKRNNLTQIAQKVVLLQTLDLIMVGF